MRVSVRPLITTVQDQNATAPANRNSRNIMEENSSRDSTSTLLTDSKKEKEVGTTSKIDSSSKNPSSTSIGSESDEESSDQDQETSIVNLEELKGLLPSKDNISAVEKLILEQDERRVLRILMKKMIGNEFASTSTSTQKTPFDIEERKLELSEEEEKYLVDAIMKFNSLIQNLVKDLHSDVQVVDQGVAPSSSKVSSKTKIDGSSSTNTQQVFTT